MTYKPKYFLVQEFVPKHVYEQLGDSALELMDERILTVADWLREHYGSTTINSWKWGGNRNWSGLRTEGSPYYRPKSQHSLGKAIDGVFKNITAAEIRKQIVNSSILTDLGLNSITIENNVSWLHVDVRDNKKGINFFNP